MKEASRRRWLSRSHINQINGMLFVAPWAIGFLAFGAYPILMSAYYSLTYYDGLRAPRFLGLGNYQELLLADRVMKQVSANTIWWVLLAVPAGIVSAFLLANLLNSRFRGRSIFRALFFVPSIVPTMVSAQIWRLVLNTNFGVINTTLVSLGWRVIPFLSKPSLAKPTLLAINCWAQGSAMVIFLAALQDVPKSLYEAATVDGASAWDRFWRITVPLCTPSAFFMLITGMIGGFQSFTFPWLLTGGGPNNATEFFSMYLYRNAFEYMKMGYASALAWILCIVVVLSSIVMFRTSDRWVFYGA